MYTIDLLCTQNDSIQKHEFRNEFHYLLTKINKNDNIFFSDRMKTKEICMVKFNCKIFRFYINTLKQIQIVGLWLDKKN